MCLIEILILYWYRLVPQKITLVPSNARSCDFFALSDRTKRKNESSAVVIIKNVIVIN